VQAQAVAHGMGISLGIVEGCDKWYVKRCDEAQQSLGAEGATADTVADDGHTARAVPQFGHQQQIGHGTGRRVRVHCTRQNRYQYRGGAAYRIGERRAAQSGRRIDHQSLGIVGHAQGKAERDAGGLRG